MSDRAAEGWKNPVTAARDVAAHTKRLVRLELELKALELRRAAIGVGIASGFGLAALLLLPLVAAFALAAAAAALATAMSVWLAILIVGASLLGLVLVLGALAYLFTRRALARLPGADA
jgi:hypothetical protein